MFFKQYRVLNIALLLIILSAALLSCRTSKPTDTEGGEAAARAASDLSLSRKIPFPAPRSHDGGWIEAHGKLTAVNLDSPRVEEVDCYTCHAQVDCIACHAVQMPRDHTNLWRNQTHGFLSGGNRERCLLCHREDYCFRCHSVTEPRSHRGNWVEGHCSECHLDLTGSFGTDCYVCHKQYAHTTAPSLVAPVPSIPHPVYSNMDCSFCHN